MNTSPAYSFIRERIELEFKKLEKDKITPWAFFLSGKGLKVTDFFGKEVSYVGVGFEGSPREKFWKSFIQPFLQDIVSKSFSETRSFCQNHGVDLKLPLEETASLLKAGIKRIYHRMSEIDQRLLGKGYPDSVPRYNPEAEIAFSEAFVEERMSAELAVNRTAETQQRRLLFLKRLYEATGGDRLTFVKDSEIGSQLGFKPEETDRIVQYLEEEGLLTYAAMGGQIAITHAGVKGAETITDIYEAQPAGPVSELERYREILQGILSRFLRTRDSIHILREDDPVYRQTVHEIVDLLDDELGSNRLSWQVENEFNQGLNNFLGSPSYKSVENIIAIVGAAITRLSRRSRKPATNQVSSHPSEAEDWDAFICHAGEDKTAVVEPLAQELQRRGLRIWYDRWVLRIGDSLRRKIDEGLAKSRYGIVVLSPDFFRKEWPQHELDGLVQREIDGRKVILPIWHNVTRDDVMRYSVTLADKFAGTTVKGIPALAGELYAAIRD